MNLNQVDLNLLVALDALLQTRNLTHAGRRLGRLQPAVSDALRRLRALFDDDLLVRMGRGFELTVRARELVGPVREILERIDRTIEERPRFDPSVDSAEFSVAVSDYASVVLIEPLLKHLARRAPNVQLWSRTQAMRSFEALEHNEIDLVVVPAVATRRYGMQPLFGDRWVCAVWSRHPDIHRRLTLKKYLALPHLEIRMDDRNWRSMADEEVERSGLERKIQGSTTSFLAAPFLLQGTRLVSLIQRRLGERLRRAAGIRLLEPPFELAPLELGMFWNKRDDSSPAHQWLRAAVHEVAASLSQ